MRVGELAVVVDLPCEVLIFFTRRFEDDLRIGEEVMASEIDFPERAFANEFPEGVIPDVSEVFGGEFSAPVRRCTTRRESGGLLKQFGI